ncbi:DUF4336 domain-containing protein [Zavarzinia compransoris]|uniref:DUF4336 domain-containing protein n=1 Tax=Zavarzinia marina TaxID=2911065 RepID=UPI001F46CD1D|nr:DUF4336 domain-containing protein [Zavarzinia marina]MCF4164747.1 DUF4336 domain-containing protein [Zavarzinia marina]
MPTPFGPEIWIAEGAPVVAAAGFHYPTRMTILRLPDGGLFVWSPVDLNGDLRTAVEALGPVRHIVAPNALHHLHLAAWIEAFPSAKVHAAPGLRVKRPDIAFDADLGDAPDPAWGGAVDLVAMRGNRITTEVVFFHGPSRTAIFTDLIQQLPPGWFSGWRAVIARLDLMMEAEPMVPRKFRLAFTDRRAARVALDHILAWPAERVLMAHGTPVTQDGQAFLARAFRWLKPRD